MSAKKIDVLKNLLIQIEKNIPFKDQKNTQISKSDIGWQLDHALKVFNAVSEWTIKSDLKDYKWHFNFWRTLLFPIGYIPRGKAKAPKYVLPPKTINTKDLQTQLHIAATHIETLKTLPEKAYFKHFVFGKLSKKQTLRFLQIHTNHHLKIVRDILK